MRIFTRLLFASLLISATMLTFASADSIDTYIQQLKDSSPDVRAKAAFELGDG